ncbi:hypothetical protein [Methylomonas methanica]|uniref:Uncharacterized protein n=1 Tax=Methylomonas methanica TaxID=421 RepID=A0A177MU96_METMH|nr:hypothetical protein [Methylomonas methanica]OAI09337.1 hypothetical protein A1332_24390 [Methylomonas methanica]
MAAEKTKDDRKKVSLNKETCKTLNTFSRLNAVKLRLVLDAMVDIVLIDEHLSSRVIELALEKEAMEKG